MQVYNKIKSYQFQLDTSTSTTTFKIHLVLARANYKLNHTRKLYPPIVSHYYVPQDVYNTVLFSNLLKLSLGITSSIRYLKIYTHHCLIKFIPLEIKNEEIGWYTHRITSKMCNRPATPLATLD